MLLAMMCGSGGVPELLRGVLFRIPDLGFDSAAGAAKLDREENVARGAGTRQPVR